MMICIKAPRGGAASPAGRAGLARPMITTDHPGGREVVEGKNGNLPPLCNSEALAKRLEELRVDPGKRLKFGQYPRMKAEHEFSEKLVGRVIKEVYGSQAF